MAIDEAAFHSSMIHRPQYATRGSRLFCSERKRSWFWTLVTAAIASSRALAIVVREGSVDGSRFLAMISSLDIPSGTCFIMNNIAFHEPAVGWISISFHALQTAFLTSGSHRIKSP